MFFKIIKQFSAGLLCLSLMTLPGMAEQKPEKPKTGALGTGWNSKTNKADKPQNKDDVTGALTGPSVLLRPDGVNDAYKQALSKINYYFNSLKSLQGRFVQKNPNRSKQTGKFYIMRPGRVRFEYAKPSFQRIISDGETLSVEDLEQKTADRYPLEQTPFQMLLSRNVNLARDGNIVKLSRLSEDRLLIAVKDKRGKAPGMITLIFKEKPEMNLVGWSVLDGQGLKTDVQLTSHDYKKPISRRLFQLENIEKPFAIPQ